MSAVKPACPDLSVNDVESKPPVFTPLVVATGIFNVVVPLCFVLFEWKHAAAFIHTLRISNLIILTKVALDIQFYVRKSTAPFVSTSAYAWLIALCATVAPLMFRPTDDASDFWVATVIQALGGAMQIYVLWTLSRRSGKVVAGSGIRRRGLWR